MSDRANDNVNGGVRPGMAWIAVALALSLWGFRLAGIQRAHFDGSLPEDFCHYYASGWRALHGESVYAPIAGDVERLTGLAMQFPTNRDGTPFRPADTPALHLFYALFAALPYAAAWWVFLLGSVASVASMTWLAAREVGVPEPWRSAVAAWSLAALPTIHLMEFNHVEGWLTLALVPGWIALRRGRPLAGGAAWGVAAGLKLFPLMLIGGLLLQRQWKAAFAGLGAAAAVFLAGAAALGPAEVATFLSDVVPQSRNWYGVVGGMSVHNVLIALGVTPAVTMAVWGLLFVVLVAGLAARARSADALLASGTAAALLLSPLSWHYYLVLTYPALVVLGARWPVMAAPRRAAWAVSLATIAFAPPLIHLPDQGLMVLASSLGVVGLALLFVLGLGLDRDRN